MVNPTAGPAWTGSPTKALQAALPEATIRELGPDDDLAELLCDTEALAIGAAGGDGTLAAVAEIAADRDLPFVAVPAGTLNHLARDLGLQSVDDAIAAVRAGTVAHMDLAMAGERCFVNTLSLGGYAHLVDARERLEGHIGKWPALLVALVRELPRMEPLCLELDGHGEKVWLAWIGNCQYEPRGFGPSWREQLDDGLLDVRVIHATRRFARGRFLVDVLTGRLASCPVYEERTVESLRVRSLDGPLRLALDGETVDGPLDLEVTKRRRVLRVAIPPYEDDERDGPRPDDSARPASTTRVASVATPAPVTQGPAPS